METVSHSYSFEFVARAYHVYQRIWNRRIGEQLQATPDHSNTKDRFAVALTKDDETVGHIP